MIKIKLIMFSDKRMTNRVCSIVLNRIFKIKITNSSILFTFSESETERHRVIMFQTDKVVNIRAIIFLNSAYVEHHIKYNVLNVNDNWVWV